MSKQAKIILFTCLYITGIIAAFSKVMLFIGIFAIFALTIFQILKKYFPLKYFISLLMIFFLGLTNANFHLKFDDNLTSYAGNDVTIKAKVISIPSNNVKNRTKFYAKALNINFDEIYKENIDAKTLITINDNQEKLDKIKIGDTLELTGRLRVPANAANPSQFDYARYLQNKNTFSLLYVNENWQIISSANDFNGKLIRKLNDTRNKILDIHRQNIQSPMIEILGGMIFGDDAVNPDDATKDAFIKSGIFHILAASGMNVTLIFGIWFFFARKLRFNYKFSIFAGIVLILVYTCMTGFGAPIIRAFLMLTLILIGKLIDKKTSTMSLLFIVGFLMLIYNPLMIFDIGFQLSFLVTFALILTAPLITFEGKHKIINCTLGACLIPVVAQFYAAPLQMYYFNTFSLYSIFANIAIVPVLSLVSFIGFISSILALIPVWANRICFVADFILNPFLIYIIKVADFFASLPYSVIDMPKPSVIQIILYFAIIILLTLKTPKRIIAILATVFALTFLPNTRSNSEIIFFSVGNADAALIKSPQNKYYIIDTGKLPYKNGSSQADYIIIKYLKDKGIKDIEGLILSHFDADHAGGTIDLFEKLNIKNIYLSDSFEDTYLSSQINKFIKENNLKYTIVNDNTQIAKENDFFLKVIKPNDENLKSENDKSIIALLQSENHKILFMGDGSTNTYESLPDEYRTDVNIIKSGHHGADNTVNDKITDNCEFFIISTGPNIYGHPSENTLNLIAKNNRKYYRTDYHNAIKVVLRNKKAEIFFYSPNQKRFIKTK